MVVLERLRNTLCNEENRPQPQSMSAINKAQWWGTLSGGNQGLEDIGTITGTLLVQQAFSLQAERDMQRRASVIHELQGLKVREEIETLIAMQFLQKAKLEQ